MSFSRDRGAKVRVVSRIIGKGRKTEVVKLWANEMPPVAADTPGATSASTTCEAGDVISMDEQVDSPVQPTESKHRRDTRLTVEGWSSLQKHLDLVSVELHAPQMWECSVCSVSLASPIRCSDCGLFRSYCVDCEAVTHAKLLHRPEIWLVCERLLFTCIKAVVFVCEFVCETFKGRGTLS